jgi:hypothetical protein
MERDGKMWRGLKAKTARDHDAPGFRKPRLKA